MKNYSLIISLIVILFFGCNKEELEIVNPNDPTFDALNSESGIVQLASGVYDNALTVGDFNYDFYWFTQAYHEAMADAIYIPWGNWSWRWANQPTSITLDDGTVITPPQEGAQGVSLESRNVRTQGDLNAYAHEWMTMYKTNNSANLLLELVETTEFPEDASFKKSILKAWGHFWKGYAYSRIGSMYVSGLIISEANVTNQNYVPKEQIIAEANANFDKAVAELNAVDRDISSFMGAIIPDHLVPSSFRGSSPSNLITKDMWVRNINTLKARNILVNKKVISMTDTDWTEILSLSGAGIQATDYIFVMKQDGNNFNTSISVPHRLLIGWHFLSERLVQDFKADDKRLADNVVELSTPQVNRSGRGIQYGTRWGFLDNDYASTADAKINIYIGGSYAENELMRAEALIYTGQIDAGLQIIDAIRNFQNAGLTAVSGTALSLEEALEELRIERRIGLLLRGIGFYDARRWGVTNPVSEGGGRTGLTVLDALGVLNTNATFDYNYLDYWSIPAQELELNSPSDGSSPVIAGNPE